jgi:hypothetical protein
MKLFEISQQLFINSYVLMLLSRRKRYAGKCEYVLDLHTNRLTRRLKIVLLYLGAFTLIPFPDFLLKTHTDYCMAKDLLQYCYELYKIFMQEVTVL